MRGNYDDEGYLDDGDLPPLTQKGSNSIASYNQDTATDEVEELKGTKLRTYKKGLKNKTDVNGRQFWDQQDDESADEGHHNTISKSNSNHKVYKASSNRYDEDGPDDEMAARRAIVITQLDAELVAYPDTDNSVPTDNESHVTDEEVEEETYETSFCGQTLNAIDDMCGGNLNLTGSKPGENRPNNTSSRRSSTTSPPIERKRRSFSSPQSGDNSRSPKNDFPPAGELQQENTAIEVEYMEPIRKTISVGSDSGAPSDTKRKTVRLNAIAKKAKEKFRSKKGKTSSTPSSGSSVQSNDKPGPPSSSQQLEIGSAVVDNISDGGDATATPSIASDRPVTSSRSLPDVVERVDSDYNNFTAAEKRKFIKLINSGVVAAAATRQVLNEQTKISGSVYEENEDEAADDDNETDSTGVNALLDVEAQAESSTPSRVENEIPGTADNSTSSAGTVPFKKSGSVYYDAVRRDVNDSDIADMDIVENNNLGGRQAGFKGLEFGVAQRFFGGGKQKGFTALPDSPQKISQESTPARLEYHGNKLTSGSDVVNSERENKNKDVSATISFDSFVRNRAIAETDDLSTENYQITPTREIAKSNPSEPGAESASPTTTNRDVAEIDDLSTENYQMTPNRDLTKMEPAESGSESASPTTTNSRSGSAFSRSIINITVDAMSDVEDSVLSTSRVEPGQDISVTENIDRSYILDTPDEQEKQKSHPKSNEENPNALGLHEQHRGASSTSVEKAEKPNIRDISQEVSRIVSEGYVSVADTEEQSQGISFISEKEIGISRMDISVDTNINTTADMSHQNDAISVYTAGTSLTGVTGTTTYTQSSRTRRPGVAKTRLAKQKELEHASIRKPQGWHETILAAAQSTHRKWDPEKGWVDYAEPDIVLADVDNKKDKIRIDLSKSVLSHKERNTDDRTDSVAERAAPIPFPPKWEKERDAMIQSTLSNKTPAVSPMKIPMNMSRLFESSNSTKAAVVDHGRNIESENIDAETRASTPLDYNESGKSEKVVPAAMDIYRNINIEQVDSEKRLIADVDRYGNVETENIDGDARSIESDVYYDDVIVVDGLEDASRNVIEVVKQKVSEDDLELFPRSDVSVQKIDDSMTYVQATLDSVEAIPKSEMNRIDTSLVSLDPSVMSSRRGAGPVDADEVDETWDSDDDERISATWQNENREQSKMVDLAENHHIDEWKDNSHPAPRYDSRSVSTSGNDTSRSTGNRTTLSPTSASKKIPKLQRSKRDTSPLSFRNPLEVAFPRSQESIQRHENYEVEYTQPTASSNDHITDKVTAVFTTNATTATSLVKDVKPSHDESHDTSIVRARLKEWESRIETSYSTDNGEPIEKSTDHGLLPVAAAGWKSFLGKKVQAEKTFAEAKESTVAQSGPVSQELQEIPVPAKVKLTPREQSTDTMFQFADTSEALNLSDLSPIQVNDDLSDYDIVSSVGYGPTEDQRKSSSFLERLTECAAPIMPTKASAFCGRPDEVIEADSIADISQASGNSTDKHRRTMSYGDEKPRSLSSLRGTSDTIRVSTSSVVSEDFGAKTAFLDSLAMKAAVSKPKRSSSSSRRYDQSGSSSVVSGATDHSEKWKMFLERKKASDASPIASRGSGADVSRAAEKYAAEKVEEIMSKMAARSKTTPRYREVRNEFNDVGVEDEQMKSRSNNVSTGKEPQRGTNSAAEDLAAARVEAMMAALANANLDEAEI